MSKTPRHQIAQIIASFSLGKMSAKRLSREVAGYLLSEGRSGELASLLRDVMQQRADKGIVEVIASSAYPLSDKVRRDIKAQVRSLYPKAQRIIISEQIDASIVGGIRLELANEQLDLSIRSKLNKLKQLTTGEARSV